MAKNGIRENSRFIVACLLGFVVITISVFVFEYRIKSDLYDTFVRYDLANLSEAVAIDVNNGFVTPSVLAVANSALKLHSVSVFNRKGMLLSRYPELPKKCPEGEITTNIYHLGEVVGTITACPNKSIQAIGMSTDTLILYFLLISCYLSLGILYFRRALFDEALLFSFGKIAHEIRSPMAKVKLAFEVMTAAETIEQFNKVRNLCQKELSKSFVTVDLILQNLGSIRKSWMPKWETIQLHSWLSGVLEELRSEAPNANITIKLESKNDILIRLDPGMIKLVFRNIIKNAGEACAMQININLKREGNFADIDITNNGKPISEVELDKIFKRYYTTKSTGTGIGLQICKEIVKAHGGSIWVYSEKGVTGFQIRLPLRIKVPIQVTIPKVLLKW